MAKKAAAAKPATKKGVKDKAAKPQTKVKASEVAGVIPERTFVSLVKDVRSADADINDAQSTKSALIKKAQKSGLHKDAFAAFQKLARKSDKAASEFMTHFEHYMEIGGINQRIRAQGELLARTPVLSEGDVAQVEGNGGRKRKNGGKVVAFDSQREREAQGEFEPGVSGEAVEASAVH